MKRKELDKLEAWFSKYSSSFDTEDPVTKSNITLKIRHTMCVRKNIAAIASQEGMPEETVHAAEAVALLHDVGRFPQLEQYGTFEDSKSFNHALLSVKVMDEQGLLKDIDPEERRTIANAVKYHNVMRLPNIDDRSSLELLRLVRDADKLDIWRVFIELYEGKEEGDISTATYGLPDTPEYSRQFVESMRTGQRASILNARTVNDFRMVHLSWVYRLNFAASYRILVERRYIDKMARWLPDKDDIREAIALLKEFAGKKAVDNVS